jgi:hypothetical protein
VTEFIVQAGDVTEVPSDLLLLKFAQNFYGADQTVASRLVADGVCRQAELRRAPGDFVCLETNATIAPQRVMFLGAPPLRSFNYGEMEVFARRAIEIVADLDLPVRTVTTTVHGTGYGLDGGESLERLVRGFRTGLANHPSVRIETITFLTLRQREERMLSAALESVAADQAVPAPAARAADGTRPRRVPAARPTSRGSVARRSDAPVVASRGISAVSKRRVFVAMPFAEEFQNVYEFGIYPAVRNCGYICERVDEAHFTGDILGRIRASIESSALIVADLTEARPNVYLEVGYAWGRGIPVICVARKGEKLHFDVSTHRCVFYGRFTQFAKDLEELIRGIEAMREA